MNISSERIEIFPLNATRAVHNSRTLTEDRISNIIRQLIDTEGFVISDQLQQSDNFLTSDFEFNIYGYFVKILTGTPLNEFVSLSAAEVWASLTLNEHKEISDQDDNGKYLGVDFSDRDPSDCTAKVKILEKVDGVWVVPEESKIKVDASSVNVKIIDGKH